jgi:alpha-glucosidase
MNEPSAWGQDIPPVIEFGSAAHPATLKKVRNIYGMQMARATYEGTCRLMGDRRPFVLSRAAYSGIQRYSAMWTGDNNPTDAHMLLGFRLINSMGLTGVPFVGMDVGGFTGNPSPALMVRWMSLGTFTPMFRNHTGKGNTRHEPWAWGETAEPLMRRSIELRYRLLPYLYSTFFEATGDGMPVNRSLAIAHH